MGVDGVGLMSGGVLENCGGKKRFGGLPGRLNIKLLFKQLHNDTVLAFFDD